jgi:hypothetical protein
MVVDSSERKWGMDRSARTGMGPYYGFIGLLRSILSMEWQYRVKDEEVLCTV